MFQIRAISAGVVALAAVFLTAATGGATTFNGTLFYTNFNGGVNVNRVDYQYNDVSKVFSLTNQKGIASLGGADGIIFDAQGHLLVGGQGTGNVFQLNTDGTGIISAPAGTASFHLALDPSGTKVYTSNFGGPLDTLPTNPIQAGTVKAVSGGDSGVTQIAFAANAPTKAFYDTGSPNGFGNFGLIDLSTGVTTRLLTGQQSIHGVIFDPFAGLITFFGDGAVGTVDPTGTNAVITASFKQRTGINADFDQGAVDGQGHALIAGNGQITFIDYAATGDITSALNTVRIVGGFGGIDDVAPLVGLGSNPNPSVPEPSTLTLLATGAFGLLGYHWRRRRSHD